MAERSLVRCCPPGELLRKELAARGLTAGQFSHLIGASLSTVHEILAARRDITPELAAAIGDVLGTGPELWLNLERQFQLDKERNLNARPPRLA